MTLQLVLGNKNYSSWSLRAWLALKRTTVAFDEVVIPIYESGSRQTILRCKPGIATLRSFSKFDTVGWDLNVPDVVRAAPAVSLHRPYSQSGTAGSGAAVMTAVRQAGASALTPMHGRWSRSTTAVRARSSR